MKRIMKCVVIAFCFIVLFTMNIEDNDKASNNELIEERIEQSNCQFANFSNVDDLEKSNIEDMAVWNPISVSPSSGCLASACAMSGCLGSGCVLSACLGSACEASGCAGSGCLISGCAGSACSASGCGGSACVGSICGGSVCVGSVCTGSSCNGWCAR